MTMRARNREAGATTIEIVIAISLLGFFLVALAGLHMVVLVAGTIADASSIATNLARARVEELLSLPRAQVIGQGNTQALLQVPAGRGRTFTVHTAVDASNAAFLDITVAVTWQVLYGSGCSGQPGVGCPGRTLTYSRMLQTRIKRL